ncbi:unnamed protein product [Polarella glacialis]|uniref:Uncharacterized protein n=1 Tax=Polarella glacialis TaxID=89957 RepID=A0A813JFQ8_POLGL|nr:unnamed protein product [Polarella glacialis]
MPLFKLNIEAAERYLTSIPLLSLEEDIVRLLSTQNPKSAGLGSQLVEKQPHLLTSGSDELVAGDEGLHHESFLANETPDKSSVSVSRLPLDVEGAERFLNSLAVRAEDCASPFCHRPERAIGSLLGLGVAPQVDVLLFLYNPLPGLHHVIVFPDSDPLRPAMGRASRRLKKEFPPSPELLVVSSRFVRNNAPATMRQQSRTVVGGWRNRSDLDRLVPGLIRERLTLVPHFLTITLTSPSLKTWAELTSHRLAARAFSIWRSRKLLLEKALQRLLRSLCLRGPLANLRAFGKLQPKDLLGNLSISPLLSGSVLRPIPPGTSFLPPGAIQAAANANSTGLIGQPCPTPENQSKEPVDSLSISTNVKVLAVVALQSQALECYAGKNHTVLRLEAYQVSVIPFVRPRRLKEELNDQFRCSHPKIHPSMTLSKLRNLLKAGTKSQLICVYTCIMPCYLY